jgi:uncharacterized protein YjgD (DUF1641 family)
MTKSEMIELLKLLAALEAVGVINHKMPDYLADNLNEAIKMLSKKVMEAE